MSIFETSYNDEPIEKLPTLLQYIKSKKGKKRPNSFHIALIWLPNRFPSYGIETDKFRLNCPSRSPMGKAIEENLDDITLMETSMHLGITENEEGLRVYSFIPGTSKGTYELFGNDKPLGVKFVPD